MEHRHIQLDRRGLGPFVREWQHTLTQQIAESPFQHAANAGLILREHVLSAKPDALGLSIDFSSSVVWLALVEVANPHDVETLILSDSQTALVSAVTGKAIVPVPNAEIAATTRALLHTASSALNTVPLATATPLPIEGRATFYFRVQSNTHGIEIDVADLSDSTDPLSVLYQQALLLIDTIRKRS